MLNDNIEYNLIIDDEESRRAQEAANAAEHMTADQIDPTTFYCTQQHDRYSDENHEVWRTMFEQRWAMLEEQASNVFIAGLKAIGLVPDHVPLLNGTREMPDGSTLSGINEFLRPLTGWQSKPVPGYLPAKAFFACLSRREFPTTVTVRPKSKIDYLPEPDIFHDIFGHVPLHADPVFADFLQTYGKAALMCNDPVHTERLARLFWFTVEFGLIHEDGRLKVYGSGIISSHGESHHALNAPEGKGEGKAERRAFDLDTVCDTSFEIDKFQPIYYVLDSFEQLRDAMNEYANRVLEGVKIKA